LESRLRLSDFFVAPHVRNLLIARSASQHRLLQPRTWGANETLEGFWFNSTCPKMGFGATLLSRKWPVLIAKGRRNQRAVVNISTAKFSRAWHGTLPGWGEWSCHVARTFPAITLTTKSVFHPCQRPSAAPGRCLRCPPTGSRRRPFRYGCQKKRRRRRSSSRLLPPDA
jgi:hypothetical protein